MHKKIHVKTKNKICAALLVFVLAGSLTAGACAVPNVYAKTEAEKKRDAYKKKLKEKMLALWKERTTKTLILYIENNK